MHSHVQFTQINEVSISIVKVLVPSKYTTYTWAETADKAIIVGGT